MDKKIHENNEAKQGEISIIRNISPCECGGTHSVQYQVIKPVNVATVSSCFTEAMAAVGGDITVHFVNILDDDLVIAFGDAECEDMQSHVATTSFEKAIAKKYDNVVMIKRSIDLLKDSSDDKQCDCDETCCGDCEGDAYEKN